MKAILTALLSAAALTAAAGQAVYADAPRNSVCIRAYDIDGMSYPDDKTIMFRMKSGPVMVYRNDLPRVCPGLKFESGIAWNVHDGTICSNMQVFYVLRRGTPCFLGTFTPVKMRKHEG
ncbi:MAG: hypothetical protein KGJ78_15545 [Alphaproteobacteria bacterium]|nr:hypothetical protein [Alphaproteobacteria bacterium]